MVMIAIPWVFLKPAICQHYRGLVRLSHTGLSEGCHMSQDHVSTYLAGFSKGSQRICKRVIIRVIKE